MTVRHVDLGIASYQVFGIGREVRWGWSGGRQRRVGEEDLFFQRLRTAGRLDAEFVAHPRCELAVAFERLGLPARLVQGGHQCRSELLVQRMVAQDTLELSQRLARRPCCDVGLCPSFLSPPPHEVIGWGRRRRVHR